MIRIGILGYGNLSKGVQKAIHDNEDMELVAIFTRRDPRSIDCGEDVPVVIVDQIAQWKNFIDVMILCGGSATDLPRQTPEIAKMYHFVDSFDTHAHIPEHFEAVDKAARAYGHVGLISCGWDPGLFSIARIYAQSVLPYGKDYTFWGRGVSQGHSDAIRRIEGVIDARQYTVPVQESMDAVRQGKHPQLTPRLSHRRECYVVVEEGADKLRIEREIVSMPNYFADYDTTVTFISAEEMRRNHTALPHGGHVIRTGQTNGGTTNQAIEFSLTLGSNPEFTGSVLCACARAVYKFSKDGATGAKTLFDVPPAYLSAKSPAELRAHAL